MDKNTVIEKVKQYAREVAREYPVRMVVLFGSYVTGHPRDDSDIDVAVVVNEISGDYLTQSARLCTLRNAIDPLIEPHLLPFQLDDSGFLGEVLRTGQVIYQAA